MLCSKLLLRLLLFPSLRQPVQWKFEGSLTRGLDKQPIDPVIEVLRKDLAQVSVAAHIGSCFRHLEIGCSCKPCNAANG